jgi:COMPASS component SPP1
LIQKKKCVKQNNWEKLRRAEIDMERVRQWLKLDELFEKERQIRTAMAQRAGLLPLILHSTFNHELMQQQQQQYAGQTGVTSDSSEAYAAANKKLAMEDDT